MDIERESVQSVYEEIAEHFDQTRPNQWPWITEFIEETDSYSDSQNSGKKKSVLDVGCGNGRNMMGYKNSEVYGIDNCSRFIQICRNCKCFWIITLGIYIKSEISQKIDIELAVTSVVINDKNWSDHRLSSQRQSGLINSLGVSWVEKNIRFNGNIYSQGFNLDKANIKSGYGVGISSSILF